MSDLAADQAFRLEGNLDAGDVALIYRQTRAACRAGRLPRRIDLSNLGQTDSSVLALMLEWQAHARGHDSSIEFQSPPENLRVLAGLSQASELLGWPADADSGSEGEAG